MSKSRKREEQNKIMRDSYLRTKQEAKEIILKDNYPKILLLQNHLLIAQVLIN